MVFENSKYLIGKGLSDGFDSVEIENNRLESINPCEQLFRLLTRNQFIIAILGESDWHHRFCKPIAVICYKRFEYLFSRAGSTIGDFHEYACA